ncbi:hypothetical protein TNCV_4903351 [Trichonephila clavipes]|uniref:Uncharacterized protein n=1 Tax=Trichonephila clavipes TaxID=2585209 RepID=A0A8X6S953_TRICX|nr:hypothetical protein TNCV_4903351 [Trichonephila clavipes]
MALKNRCVLVLIRRAFHNDEKIQRMSVQTLPRPNASASSLDHPGNGSRVFAFRGFTPYTPTSICPKEHKT